MEKSEALGLIDTVSKARKWDADTFEAAFDYIDDATSILFGLDTEELAKSWPKRPDIPGWDKLGLVWRQASGAESREQTLSGNIAEQAGEFGDDVSDFSEGVGKIGKAFTNVAGEAGDNPEITLILVGLGLLVVLVVLWKLS